MSPAAASAAASASNASLPHPVSSAASTTSRTARAVTAAMVRNSIAGRTAGPVSSARSAATEACVCSSWRSIRVRWAAISRFLASRSGAARTAAIESSGMPRSRSRLMTCADPTWLVSYDR